MTVPIVIMGYYNPMLAYGFDKLAKETAAAGGNGFIIVDLPPEEATQVMAAIEANGLAYVPLITPTTTDERMAKLASVANSFIYCVSVTGAPPPPPRHSSGARTRRPSTWVRSLEPGARFGQQESRGPAAP